MTLVLVVLLGLYAVWPMLGLYRLASAVEAKDADTVTALVEFPALRRSLTRQIAMAYRERTGKKKKRAIDPLLKGFAMRYGISVADPIVARLVTVRALLDLLAEGRLHDPTAATGTKQDLAGEGLAPLAAPSLGNAWQVWLQSDYRGRNFSVRLPPRTSPDAQYRLQLRLIDWQWRLTGLELPVKLRNKLVDELVQAMKE